KGMSGTFRLVESYKPKKPMETMIGVAIKAVNEPKEASVGMIKKYIREHYPTLDIENRMFLLKRALEKGVKNGELEQITGKGAS
ncbi:PREDICTED: heterochromatin protein 1-binding protein 3-like, partial [Branchiostoma belcheri]